MEPASPARLYAAAVGALLFLLGIGGFFAGADFGAPGEVADAVAGLRVNGWLNLLYAALGALGLLAAGGASRAYARGAGALLTVLGIWGLARGSGEVILGLFPAAGANDAVALVLGLLGLLAAAGTAPAGNRRRRRLLARRREPAKRPTAREERQTRRKGGAAGLEARAQAPGDGA